MAVKILTKNVLLERARALNGQSTTPDSNQGCRPALDGKGGLAARARIPDVAGILMIGIFIFCIQSSALGPYLLTYI